jgi:hypothetical protein
VQSREEPSSLFEVKVSESLATRSSHTWPRRQTQGPFVRFAAAMDTVPGNVMAGRPDAPSALEHTRGPDIGAEQMIAHLKKGYGAQRTKPYAA